MRVERNFLVGCWNFQNSAARDFDRWKVSRSADLEIGDTAGLETCATAKPGIWIEFAL
jgi:hypothetical protein